MAVSTRKRLRVPVQLHVHVPMCVGICVGAFVTVRVRDYLSACACELSITCECSSTCERVCACMLYRVQGISILPQNMIERNEGPKLSQIEENLTFTCIEETSYTK